MQELGAEDLCPIMPHIDYIAKIELEAINELLCDGKVGDAAVGLGKFLDNVHVLVEKERH